MLEFERLSTKENRKAKTRTVKTIAEEDCTAA